MDHTATTFQLLYVSQLARDADFSVVKAIAAAARQHNRVHGITGALLFDGERFGQLIEGSEASVRALMERVAGDPRHTDVAIVHAEPSGSGRALERWASGYCDPLTLQVFGGDLGLRGRPALDTFLSLFSQADVD